MLIISCKKSSGGVDHYVLPEMESIEQVREYARKELPIECYSTFYIHKRNILEADCFRKCFVYLNNYISFSDVTTTYFTMFEDDVKRLQKEKCNTCKNKDNIFGCSIGYKQGEELIDCLNYEENIPAGIWKLLKRKFN